MYNLKIRFINYAMSSTKYLIVNLTIKKHISIKMIKERYLNTVQYNCIRIKYNREL